MNVLNPAVLINLLGFTVGVALYALLLVMVISYRRKNFKVDLLLLTTAILGLLWNTGELFELFYRDFFDTSVSPMLSAIAFSALGFLPSVVVHSAEKSKNKFGILTATAYALSFFTTVIHFQSAVFYQIAPSNLALKILSFGSIALLAGLLTLNFKQALDKKTIWASALLIFAVSAFHLSGTAEESSWLVELVAHQSSLPLAIAILLQDYRFAFADLFLKRAVSLILLAFLAFILYVFIASPLLRFHETHDRNDVQAIGLILTLWMATALIYPALHKFAVWLVDKIILRRADYEKLQTFVALEIEKLKNGEQVLQFITGNLSLVLTAKTAGYESIETAPDEIAFTSVNFSPNRAEIFIPTVEPPYYQINLSDFSGGRRLLSEETAILEAVSLLASRRIDALRVSEERFEQQLREKEFSKLAAEAQLSALRAQINPHFLFNSLTTIGYLINSAPDKAFETLMKLTRLLRGSLRPSREFSTLEDEINLIENYLEIEKARFEERLEVKFDVSDELKKLRVPVLILQPLVENAVKHGISANKKGGEIKISAELQNQQNEVFLKLSVCDSGAGKNSQPEFNSNGVGLNNIRARLKTYYGAKANLTVISNDENGTVGEIILPVNIEVSEK